ncbi:hypothetical protein Clacol_006869 [Clathrus columnatus]|uniref:Glucose-methanol-choline oxidoreductase N-terminal domain-containing protein n=1 Tax=Clathrus columnatus TaxID=1419009 RepID=A0AAV5AI54_9AGAM|nr:hypothetical protein Clacol_006869 [Clathrus columnatus]
MTMTTYKPRRVNDITPQKKVESQRGGGTAGCVLANRLTEDPEISVLLLEKGKPSFTWSSRVPLLSCNFRTNTLCNIFNSVPQKQLGGKAVKIITGCGLGGSSRINAMLYTRGLPCQFDAWSEEGRKGWSYEELLPYFLKSERALDETKNGAVHSVTGLWKNRSFKSYFKTTDSNPVEPIYGVAKASYTIDEHSHRSDTASAFLSSQEERHNLHICVDALVSKIVLNSSKGVSAKGVSVERYSQKSDLVEILAKREIIICAGTIGSPQLLMLSGIGPRDHLLGLGIDVRKDLPGVGSNLRDHACIPVSFNVPIKDSLENTMNSSFSALGQLLEYITTGDGAFRAPIHEVHLWAKTDMLLFQSKKILDERPSDTEDPQTSVIPDIEILATSFGDLGKSDKGGFSLWAVPVKPQSRGVVRLTTVNPRDPPACNLNLFGDPRDRLAARVALRLCLRIKEQMATNGYPITDNIVPKGDMDAALDSFVVERGRSLYHYCSSCRMAPEHDTLAPGVVNDELRVHGVSNLRIADASVFPDILSTHLQATVVAVAEKCADMVKKARNPLA